MLAFEQRIEHALNERNQHGLTRQLSAVQTTGSAQLVHAGRKYDHFSSNDYLGLASDRSLVEAWQQGLARFGAGSGASPLVSGFSPAHQRLEALLCEWLGYSRAILFSSGFSANQALLFTLLEEGDLLLQDKLNHASLIEAGLLSSAQLRRFQHNNLEHLNQLLTAHSSQHALVVTEGVFSMDGDRAPLSSIQQQIGQRAWLMVDDAHGIGVLGGQGRGSCAQAGIHPDILVVTFGKALGLSGAAILCSEVVGDYLTQFARHHVYSTAMPPAQAYALCHSIQMVQQQSWRREKLQELSMVYDQMLTGVPGFVSTSTPIKPFILGTNQRAITIADRLRDGGIWVGAIRPPTVPTNQARLRITLTANHTNQQVIKLADALMMAMEGQL
ncbi:8-amino-7-oxononanoate synthase [Vibrio metschnikovii]|uniref:8-amino-7-oxononanoate synthase n=1 Tax=Vibrio metschnikovii TaxID=28172 RepID=UPI001C2FDC5F|nr:8-amino-7-oxononanoate synthase [Vibrio metschnikovii]